MFCELWRSRVLGCDGVIAWPTTAVSINIPEIGACLSHQSRLEGRPNRQKII